ncbi:MAG TPA: prephenate dehydratase [Bacteroidetes bacterium]|nr:prephenate dehydratase [Bacteroidota bacterium]
MKPVKILIQGGYGAFHEMAARHYFGDVPIEILPRNTFRELIRSLKKHQADYGIMAIENSLAGSILPNYALLRDSPMFIVGEIYLRIKQNLVALPGERPENLLEVYSHPMAILQCQDFFDRYPHIRLIENMDTALSAREIREKQLTRTGAIASEIAAVTYGLEILAESIETNKSSIHFALAHEIGSLSKILSIFSFHNINLSKIQSLPIVGKDWEYQFYVDLEYDSYERYRQSLEAARPFTSELGILGEYRKGRSVI